MARRINTPNRAVNLWGAGKDGFRSGNKAAFINPTENSADFMNMLQEELAAIVESTGLALDPANNAQVLLAIQKMIESRAGNYVLDTGAANAYVVALSPAITAYTAGLIVSVKILNGNTGPSTLNAGAGVIPLVNDVNGALAPGDAPTGCVIEAVYDAVANKFIVSSLLQSQGDARYLQINNTTAGLVETFGPPGGALNRRYVDITALIGLQYNGAAINAEWCTFNNTGWNGANFAVRDVIGACYVQGMTDGGQFFMGFAASAAAGTTPVWGIPVIIDLANGYDNIVKPGTAVDFLGTTAPPGYLARPLAATNVNVSAYPALASAIGINWGNGATTAAGAFAIGTMYIIVTIGTTNYTLIGAASNTVGTVFAATGVGAGTGTAATQFGLPVAPADYADVAANANIGTQSVGAIIAHTHTYSSMSVAGTMASAGATGGNLGVATGSTGGIANLAAGVRVLKCVKY